MSLQTRLADFITAVGADIKALQANSVTPQKRSASSSSQNITGANNLYLAGSSLSIPQGKIKVGTIYRCRFNVTKTAAGTAAPIVDIRIGTNGTVFDTAVVSATFAAQTAVVDDGVIEIEAAFRVAGSSAVLQLTAVLHHKGGTTGLSTSTSSVIASTSNVVNVTGSGLFIGTVVRPGTSADFTIALVTSELVNLA